ncbi:metalloregulator ArsR/SmtB family transcription factor [Sporolactobacillus shoreicorticis]|uniref:ArsR/SmtB family transcription factor n=1 Tax=Sporolactobacillus shoreicorticis TaxID=1923877 RepID=A0ABW5S7U8_9BACL|nr:metalloregulator ArsR/SmtB family transcription factor [Sporolactobacillus shoreicorticis]MCO7125534.1 metalloregulator ArsR/SmtB family transcription factor [Sporolactobacillus shoreicorticis]
MAKKPEVHYVTSPVFELLAAMFRVATPSQIQSDDVLMIKGKAIQLKQWVDQRRLLLPSNVKDELDVFFSYESFLGLTLIRYAWETKAHQDVALFLKALTKLDAREWFAYFLHTGYGSGDSVDPNQLSTTTAAIDQSNLPEQEKWKLLYLYVHKEETKQRVIQLLRTFYGLISDEFKYFLAQQQVVLDQVKDFAESLGADSFLMRVSKKYQMPVNQMDEIVLAPSVFYDQWSFTTSTDSFCLFLFGIRQLPFEESAYSADKDKVDQAFKVLADEKRLSIIRLLNRSPLYGYELGKRLNLSNSTISHHLSLLASYDLVRPVRNENRVYYEVKNDQIKKLMEQMLQSLIKD